MACRVSSTRSGVVDSSAFAHGVFRSLEGVARASAWADNPLESGVPCARSSVDRALASGARGRPFESARARRVFAARAGATTSAGADRAPNLGLPEGVTRARLGCALPGDRPQL